MNYQERSLISDFTGLPLTENPRKNRYPKDIKDIIDQVWDSWKIGTETTPEQIISEKWEKIVGHKLAGKCAPEKLDSEKGVLTIRTAGSSIKQELCFLRAKILSKISKLEGCSKIREIKIF